MGTLRERCNVLDEGRGGGGCVEEVYLKLDCVCWLTSRLRLHVVLWIQSSESGDRVKHPLLSHKQGRPCAQRRWEVLHASHDKACRACAAHHGGATQTQQLYQVSLGRHGTSANVHGTDVGEQLQAELRAERLPLQPRLLGEKQWVLTVKVF